MINVIEERIKLAKQVEPELTSFLKKLSVKYSGKLIGLKYKLKHKIIFSVSREAISSY